MNPDPTRRHQPIHAGPVDEHRRTQLPQRVNGQVQLVLFTRTNPITVVHVAQVLDARVARADAAAPGTDGAGEGAGARAGGAAERLGAVGAEARGEAGPGVRDGGVEGVHARIGCAWRVGGERVRGYHRKVSHKGG